MQERESVRNEIPLDVVDRLENEWRMVQVERSSFRMTPKVEVADRARSKPIDGLGAAEG
ncbi:hypothetical protein [Rhizobium sp. BK602]|uniref:hypothetical protein n=1 Tax=Rhizobium sp. BK602 TaxID=2586986 RepID=UPI00161410C5|nr:hypothetical protein [Rhizobium sp. BK602]MBB3612660.1 cell division protein FtsL [Rhizobium sp. BK602]